MRIVYRDGWEETFIVSTRIEFGEVLAVVYNPTGAPVACYPPETIREVYAL
jgi:hypothetical protein